MGTFACEANGLGPMPVTYAQCCPEPEADTCVRSDAEEVRRPLHCIALHSARSYRQLFAFLQLG